MRRLFPVPGGVRAWHKAALGRNPFPCDGGAACASFFRPAARLCRKAVPAEKALPSSLSPGLRGKIGMALRFWQVSQEITGDFALRGKLLPGMDMPMTLNFAMALGNYSRFFLFSGAGRLPVAAALSLHAAFAEEMARMPAAMALPRKFRSPKHSPASSALRLAAAFSAALEKGER